MTNSQYEGMMRFLRREVLQSYQIQMPYTWKLKNSDVRQWAREFEVYEYGKELKIYSKDNNNETI